MLTCIYFSKIYALLRGDRSYDAGSVAPYLNSTTWSRSFPTRDVLLRHLVPLTGSYNECLLFKTAIFEDSSSSTTAFYYITKSIIVIVLIHVIGHTVPIGIGLQGAGIAGRSNR